MPAGSRPDGVETTPQVVDGLGQPLGRVERRGASRLRQHGRRGERGPAVAEVGHPLAGLAAVATDPDRGVGSRRRPGVGRDASGVEVPALERHVVARPDGLEDGQRLIEQLVALGVVDAQRRELALQVAGAHGQREAPTGQHVERRAGLGHHEGVAVRQHDHVGDQADPVGGRRREARARRTGRGRRGRRLPASAARGPGGRCSRTRGSRWPRRRGPPWSGRRRSPGPGGTGG